MNPLEPLLRLAGRLTGENRLHDPHSNRPEDTPSTAVISAVLGGRFVRIDYTWSYRGAPQEGSLLVGHDSQEGAMTAHWVDTWHNGDKVMACRGATGGQGVASVRGSYAAPPGPDWGWRIDLVTSDANSLRINMFNIEPDGQEAPAVEAKYARA